MEGDITHTLLENLVFVAANSELNVQECRQVPEIRWGETDKQTDRRTVRHTDRETDRDRNTETKTERNRQTCRQTDRQTEQNR